MITTTDTANILYGKCQDVFGITVYQGGNVSDGEVEADGRVVIHTKEQTPETTWKKGFVEINLFARDTKQGKADLIRLNKLERMAVKNLKGTGIYDGTVYNYKVSSTATYAKEDLNAHYVNAKVLFRVQNTIE